MLIEDSPFPRKSAWHIALAGMVALAVAMGIGRFAFTPLFPMMLHDGAIDLNQGGWLATSNYLGYFISALFCAYWHGWPPARTIRAGLLATIVLTSGMGLLQMQSLWLVLRLLSGIVSALVFVYSSGWCLQKLVQLQLPSLGGVIYCGPGLGIVLTGSGMVSASWHASSGWLAFGLLAVVLTLMVWKTFSGDVVLRNSSPTAGGKKVRETAQEQREVYCQVIAYGTAGFGYIITATLLPVIARQALPVHPGRIFSGHCSDCALRSVRWGQPVFQSMSISAYCSQ